MKVEETTVVAEDGNDPTHFSATLNNDGTVDAQDLTPDSGNDDALRFNAMAAVQAALNQEPTEFGRQIQLGLADRVQDAVERKRDEVAQAIFGPSDQEVAVDDNDAPSEDDEEVGPEAPEEAEEAEIKADEEENG
jgi:hypothetical protein